MKKSAKTNSAFCFIEKECLIMGLDQYLNITITTTKATVTPERLQRTKETLNSLLKSHQIFKSHQVNDIYTINPESSTVELEPVVNIDGYKTDNYELFHVNCTERDYRKANQIQNYFEERFYKDGNDNDGDEYDNVVTKIDDLTIDDIIECIDNIESSENKEATAKEEFPTTEGFFYGSTDYDESYFDTNTEFKNDLIELQKIRNQINEKLENTDYYAIITYSSWW